MIFSEKEIQDSEYYPEYYNRKYIDAYMPSDKELNDYYPESKYIYSQESSYTSEYSPGYTKWSNVKSKVISNTLEYSPEYPEWVAKVSSTTPGYSPGFSNLETFEYSPGFTKWKNVKSKVKSIIPEYSPGCPRWIEKVSSTTPGYSPGYTMLKSFDSQETSITYHKWTCIECKDLSTTTPEYSPEYPEYHMWNCVNCQELSTSTLEYSPKLTNANDQMLTATSTPEYSPEYPKSKSVESHESSTTKTKNCPEYSKQKCEETQDSAISTLKRPRSSDDGNKSNSSNRKILFPNLTKKNVVKDTFPFISAIITKEQKIENVEDRLKRLFDL